MKTYRRKSMKNKTKKNKRRYKLKGGMGPGDMAYTRYNCPNCGSKNMTCFYDGVNDPEQNAKCTCHNEGTCHKYSPSGKMWSGTYAELVGKVKK